MLPFLKKRQEAGISGIQVKQRAPDEKPEAEEDKDAAIHSAAQDLINAVHSKDPKATADALRSAFEICDSEPHEEGPHVEPHSYEASKE